MKINFRPATPDDLLFARDLYLESSRWLIEHYFGWDERREHEKFPNQFDAARSQIILIDDQDSGWLQTEETDANIEVGSLYIVKDLRGQGLGTRILSGIMNDAAATGKTVTLSTAKINPAKALYERLGFRIIREEERKFFFIHDAKPA